MKNKHLAFLNVGDKVKLNNLGLHVYGNRFENEPFTIVSVDVDQDDRTACELENGYKWAKDCDCYLRYNLKSDIKNWECFDIIFEEMSIINLKNN